MDKAGLLEELEAFEGDTVLVPVAAAPGFERPRVSVEKSKIVAMVETWGDLWMLQVIDGVAMLEPIDSP